MSKRFGRNQKRAMRAEIEQGSAALLKVQKELAAVRSSVQPMRDALDNVARVLGQHFIALPVVERMVSSIQRNYRIPSIQHVDFTYAVSNSDMAHMVSVAAYELEVGRLRAYADDFRGQVHMRFALPSGEVAYGISMQAMQQMRPQDWQRELAPMIAREMGFALCNRRVP